MTKKFDLVVIGSGAAGSTAAHKGRAAGWQVAVVDDQPFGGTCALRGCDPKKILVGAAELIDWQRRMVKIGVTSGESSINWPGLIGFKRTFTDPVPANRERGFAKAGIVAFHGRAKFISENTLKVGSQTLSARHILIAAGARPASLNIPGAESLINSTQFLELDQLPERIIFVGGGYISFEFAHIAARAGAQVTILHRGSRPLEGFDPDLVDELIKATHELGIELHLETAVLGMQKTGRQIHVQTETKSGQEIFTADLAVHGAGRVPDIDDLDLEKGNVKRTRKGVSVNEYLQSQSNPAVYAAGDAAASPGLPLTPVAGLEGMVVASNLIQGNQVRPDYSGVPSVVFTLPPLASVGLSEAVAREQGLKFTVKHEMTADWYSTERLGEKHSGYKVLAEEATGRILGAHLFGHNAEEVINLFAMAIRLKLTAADIKKMMFAYPTSGSDIAYMV